MEPGMLLRLYGLMNFILFWSHSISSQGREPYLGDFVEKNFNISLCSDTDGQILSNLVWW